MHSYNSLIRQIKIIITWCDYNRTILLRGSDENSFWNFYIKKVVVPNRRRNLSSISHLPMDLSDQPFYFCRKVYGLLLSVWDNVFGPTVVKVFWFSSTLIFTITLYFIIVLGWCCIIRWWTFKVFCEECIKFSSSEVAFK